MSSYGLLTKLIWKQKHYSYTLHVSVLRFPLIQRRRRAADENGLTKINAESSGDVSLSTYLKMYYEDLLKCNHFFCAYFRWTMECQLRLELHHKNLLQLSTPVRPIYGCRQRKVTTQVFRQQIIIGKMKKIY